MTLPLGTSTASSCSHGKKVYKATNFITQWENSHEILQGLFKCHATRTPSGTQVCDLPQAAPQCPLIGS